MERTLQLEKLNKDLHKTLKKLEDMKVLLEASLKMERELELCRRYDDKPFNPAFYTKIIINGQPVSNAT